MHVWLVDDRDGTPGTLESLLRQLEGLPGSGMRLLGVGPYRPELFKEIQALSQNSLDLVVLRERALPESFAGAEAAATGLGLVVATSLERADRFRALAAGHPLVYVPDTPNLETLWLALLSGAAERQRESAWKERVVSLQQRLNDRIVIERAKGFLVQRLAISEEDAYRRLRTLSRRQRRQIRDIAQSLLDTQMLFAPELNGQARQKTELPERDEEPKESS
jgi:hypothetical protein